MTCDWSWWDTVLFMSVGALLTSVAYLAGQARGLAMGRHDDDRS